MSNKMNFFSNCVSWDSDDVDVEGGLIDLIGNCTSITRRTFLSHVNKEDVKALEAELGYSKRSSEGLTMANDWHVTYFKSKHHGQTVYGFRYSAVEFVFK